MKVIWKHAPISAVGVVDRLKDVVFWKPKTVQTLLTRLTSKGVLKREKADGVYQFSPVFDESECLQNESKSFLDRVFDGKVAPFLSCLVDSDELTKEEIEELKDILNGKNV